jgi:hypothetical protein
MCLTSSRLTEERALSRRQLMMVLSPFLRWLARPLLPKGWTGSSFKTAGEVDAQRVALQTLGTRLANLSILSFLCKSASVATSFFASDQIAGSAQLESIVFLLTMLAVQAVPSALTLLLLSRFHFSSGRNSSGALMQTLLTHESAVSSSASQRMERDVEVVILQSELQRLRAQVEGNAQQSAQMVKLRESNQTLEKANQRIQEAYEKLEQAYQRSRDEIAQLRHQVVAAP